MICTGKHEENLIFPALRPWELVAPFVGVVVPNGGFFIIPDIRNATPSKEIYQAIVEVLQGNVSARQIEEEFTLWAGKQCT